ncbi:hypothetical protein, partial [Chitinophaga sp.]|uniref:hypothetical protein n=1 Tax=Chitinophaga sp. TaxID=1869181 RepID=UPI002F9353A6
DTYPFFPGNFTPDFETTDLDDYSNILAEKCINYQLKNNFQYLVIPTRYYDDNPSSYFPQCTNYFVRPFLKNLADRNISKTTLLSVIVKKIMLTDIEKRNEVLNWITGHRQANGVYLIFENDFKTKQIKDFDYLLNVLKFIRVLKENGLEVHLGYTNTEAFLYSIAMPDSISIGSYENLRSFGIKRFQDLEKNPMRSPNARLYSSKLLQWIDYQYIDAMRDLIPHYEAYFDDSEYRPLMLKPDFKWHFAKSEPYKHYFVVFDKQIKSLPANQIERIDFVRIEIEKSIETFKEIQNVIYLDENSDGSHLPTWLNVIKSFQKSLI